MQTESENLSDIAEKESHTIFGFFVTHFRVTYLVLCAIILLGGYSLITLPREADPEVKIPFAMVNTVYPGATPADVEDLVTKKIEDKIKNLENVRRYTSSSANGFSSVFVEYEASADLEISIRKLKDSIDEAKPLLPADADDPAVIEIRANDLPIVTYSLVGNYTDQELKAIADTLQASLESIKGVSKATVLGGVAREFQVLVDQGRLQQFGISINQVVSAIFRTNLNTPVGDITIDGFNYNVRVKGRFTEADVLNDVVIATTGDTPVYVRDIARVVDTVKDRSTVSRIGFPNTPAQNTVSLQVYKRTGGNIVDIVDEANNMVALLQTSNTLPSDVTIEKTNDNAVFIREDLSQLGSSGVQTMILIFILLAIVIGFREALITGLSVPIAFLMTFVALSVQGMTLNSIVLFALVLSLGLMVDNSIVVIEGINDYINQGKTPRQAALLSIWNYKWPIISGTMTTVSAFLPMLLVSGILGEYIAYLPKTITWTLISSLFVALIIIPTFAALLIKPGKKNNDHEVIKQGFVYTFIEHKKKYYINLLQNILPHKKKRRQLIVAAWGLFALTLLAPLLGLMKVEMFPSVDIDYFVVNIELPAGSDLAHTEAVTFEAERIVAGIPELKNYVTNLGTSASVGATDAFSSGSGASENQASITVNLLEKKERTRSSFAIANSIREPLATIAGGKATVVELQAGPPTGAPVEVRIVGPDIKVLGELSTEVMRMLGEIPGTINITDSIEDSTGEFVFEIDKQQANYYGLDITSIALLLRSAVHGVKASAVTIGGTDADITVTYDPNVFRAVDDLENITLQSPHGAYIPLKQVANVSFEPSVVSIQHRDGEKTVTIRADVAEGVVLQGVLAAFEEKRSAWHIPEAYSLTVGGEVEDIEQSFQEMFYSMIVAVLLIMFILVLQFNSFKQPFIILFTLPLAFIGVIVGLTIMRQPFGFPVFIGIVALSGIAVNDAIVLIDKVNKNLASGMDYVESIIDGGASRIQPILLTSITTIAGIFPLIFANELWRGLSYTVIFGLIASTVLTLVVVPVMYASWSWKEYEKKQHGE